MTQITQEQYDAIVARNQELEAKIKAGRGGGSITPKVSAKGAVSVYGLGRFPVTLYGSQWERLLKSADVIAEFIAAHGDELATKD